MAKAKRKQKLDELAGTDDPRAPLAADALLKAAQDVVKVLRKDLATRANESPAITAALTARHAKDKAKQVTADSFAEWQERFVEQVAAAWLLSCVFVRVLEDRGLLGRARIAGVGADDSQRQFFEMSPSLTERDYLLTVFRELSKFSAAHDLFDARHNPVWLLAPSAEAAKTLLAVFRTPSTDAPALRFGQPDTRFIGDLYQDLDEGVRERYALLQTPRFVESFILDRTLEPAIEKFGLDDTTVIDPTCGSGHFLLGSFERLFDHRLRVEPGLHVREAARQALDAVFGADINAYAVAISRFRLTLAFLEKAGFRKLADAPELPLHVVVADSLLHNPHVEQMHLADQEGVTKESFEGEAYALEDERAARDVLHRKFTAVVGNPPFGPPFDKSRKETYRKMYRSAAEKFVLSAPFVERFFQLGRNGAHVGLINSVTFANKRFGRVLIDDVLPQFDILLVASTSGIYFPPPGFGVPTAIIVGRVSPPTTYTRICRHLRLDPGEYDDGSQGLAWRELLMASECADRFEGEFISCENHKSPGPGTHPWILRRGPAEEFVELLESMSPDRLRDYCAEDGIGTLGMSNADEIFLGPVSSPFQRALMPYRLAHLSGSTVRDYQSYADNTVFWPYDSNLELVELSDSSALRILTWFAPYLEERATFGIGTYRTDEERTWYQWHQVTRKRVTAKRIVAFPEMSTENHFVILTPNTIASQSLMCFEPSPELSDEAVRALLGYLNSSSCLAWIKTKSAPVSTARGDISKEKGLAERERYRLPAGEAEKIPVPRFVVAEPTLRAGLSAHYSALLEMGHARQAAVDHLFEAARSETPLRATILDAFAARDRELLNRGVVSQEEIDWLVYAGTLGLQVPWVRPDEVGVGCPPTSRPFLGSGPNEPGVARTWIARADLFGGAMDTLRPVEQSLFKRSWSGRRGAYGRSARTPEELGVECIVRGLFDRLEREFAQGEVRELSFLMRAAARASDQDLLDRIGLERAVLANAISFVAACRYTERGLGVFGRWTSLFGTWQPRRANGVSRSDLEYTQDDMHPDVWRVRGTLDVPVEHFIYYSHCELESEPVLGWAGWNHEQRAKALATLYWSRKTGEGWQKERLTPMLAGLLELLPWLHQWHGDKSDDYGGDSPANYFQGFLDAQCAELGLSHDDLRAWRPPEKRKATAGGRKKTSRKAVVDDA